MDTSKAAVTRSACDRCRAKRVRCSRGEDNTAPCARCIKVGAPCVTGSPGHPGRPRKARFVHGTIPRGRAMTPVTTTAGISSPAHSSAPTDGDCAELHTPASGELTSGKSMSVNMPTEWFDEDTASLDLLDHLGGVVGLELSRPDIHLPKDSSFQDDDSGSCTAPGSTSFSDFLLTEERPASDSILTLVGQLSNPLQHQELPGAADSLEMMYMGQNSNDMFDVDSFLNSSGCLLGPSPVPCPSAASSLMSFQEKIEQRVSAISAFFSNPRNVVEGCKEDESIGMTTENPVALVLTCTTEFLDIIQNLTAATRPAPPDTFTRDGLVPPNTAPWAAQVDSLRTETTLLILSSYLTLMRLYDSLFQGVRRCFCQQPSESIKSLKVKSVFRIGGISSLQDMPVKAYAAGIIDVIQSQIQAVERCVGIPAAYCLSGEQSASQSTRGIFASIDRARLFHTVMTQQDVRSQGGDKSYVESIRENIKYSMAFFSD